MVPNNLSQETAMSKPECFEVFAVRYGHMAERTANLNFLGGDPHEMSMAMDYFVWVLRGPQTTWVVDTGYSEDVAAKRGRHMLRNPADGLRDIGIEADTVKNVIITHLHYDHVGNWHLFPSATFHLQDSEMQYATGRHMGHTQFSDAYEVDEVCAMVRRVYAGRVRFHDGDAELTPGLSVHHIGGHTMGLQSVRVWTKRGWVVLASDASHYYANMEGPRPFSIVFSVGGMIEGYRRLRDLADTDAHIVPGHDPLVMERYPAVPGLEGKAVRLDEAPTT
jgi:glyoxylase-like metal-dependent hydrolase (beta-lactamase superfamily II)